MRQSRKSKRIEIHAALMPYVDLVGMRSFSVDTSTKRSAAYSWYHKEDFTGYHLHDSEMELRLAVAYEKCRDTPMDVPKFLSSTYASSLAKMVYLAFLSDDQKVLEICQRFLEIEEELDPMLFKGVTT